MIPTRRIRRDLGRRADRVLRALRGMPLDMPRGATARTHAVLAGERVDPIVVDRMSVAAAIVGADDLLSEIAAAEDGRRWPVLIAIGGWVQVGWLDLTPMAWGGAA